VQFISTFFTFLTTSINNHVYSYASNHKFQAYVVIDTFIKLCSFFPIFI